MTSIETARNFLEQSASTAMLGTVENEANVRKLRLPSQRLSGRLEKLSQRATDCLDTDSLNSGRSGDRSEDFESPDREIPPPQHVNVASLETYLKPSHKIVSQGLYFSTSSNTNISEARRYSGTHSRSRRPFAFPLPVMDGLRALNEYKPFKLPHNIYCPGHSSLKIAGWRPTKKNMWVDVTKPHSSGYYHQHRNDQHPTCNCKTGCLEDCLNRMLQCECDPETCPLGEVDCGNRAFQVLTKQLNDGRSYAKGFEIFETPEGKRGFGLKAIRSYLPGELIVEYAGDVISQAEVQRRLNDEYKNAKNYYMLSLGKGLVIDSGMRGSPARFVNHSCNPNSQMQKWFVSGMPRIGLFAGPKGIPAGTEISYDYNFAWFDNAIPQKCLCGEANCRGTISKRVSPPEPAASTSKVATSKVAPVDENVTRANTAKIKLKYRKTHISLPGKRPVGRPRKHPREVEEPEETPSVVSEETTVESRSASQTSTESNKKRRGRPPKTEPVESSEPVSTNELFIPPAPNKKGRGRPPKIRRTRPSGAARTKTPAETDEREESEKPVQTTKPARPLETANSKVIQEPIKRGRGRPPKILPSLLLKRGPGRPPKFTGVRGVGRPRKRHFFVRNIRRSTASTSAAQRLGRQGRPLGRPPRVHSDAEMRAQKKTNIRNGWTRDRRIVTRSNVQKSEEPELEEAEFQADESEKETPEPFTPPYSLRSRTRKSIASAKEAQNTGAVVVKAPAMTPTIDNTPVVEVSTTKDTTVPPVADQPTVNSSAVNSSTVEMSIPETPTSILVKTLVNSPIDVPGDVPKFPVEDSVTEPATEPVNILNSRRSNSLSASLDDNSSRPKRRRSSSIENVDTDSAPSKRTRSRSAQISIVPYDAQDDDSDYSDQTSEFLSDLNGDSSKKRGRPRKPADELKIYRRTGKPRGRPKKVKGYIAADGTRLTPTRMRLRSSARRSYTEFVDSESEEMDSDISDEFSEASHILGSMDQNQQIITLPNTSEKLKESILETTNDDTTPNAVDILMNLKSGRITEKQPIVPEAERIVKDRVEREANPQFTEMTPQSMGQTSSSSPNFPVRQPQLSGFSPGYGTSPGYGHMPLVYYSYVDGPQSPMQSRVMMGGSPAPMPYVPYQPVYAVSPQFATTYPYPVQMLPSIAGASQHGYSVTSVSHPPTQATTGYASPVIQQTASNKSDEGYRSWRNIVGI